MTVITFSGFGFIDFNGDGNRIYTWECTLIYDTLSYVYIFFGPDFGAEPDVIIGHPLDFPARSSVEFFALEVVNVGDVDGDGWEDLGVIVLPLMAFIVLRWPDQPIRFTTIFWRVSSSELSSAGDVNGDGYDDILGR